MGRKSIFTSEQAKALDQMIIDGYSVADVASKFNCSEGTVFVHRSKLRVYGLLKNTKPISRELTDEDIEKMKVTHIPRICKVTLNDGRKMIDTTECITRSIDCDIDVDNFSYYRDYFRMHSGRYA